ncbi:hypothetical protein QCA50_011665 [Cerrena zonata]|uniref:Uncharacterized protein n=1 Tax=Cerrena zonata TaxID=2478898 RepID=A0AAW0G6K0_9APHY
MDNCNPQPPSTSWSHLSNLGAGCPDLFLFVHFTSLRLRLFYHNFFLLTTFGSVLTTQTQHPS